MGEGVAVGAAAEVVGVEAHVLRHWEDVGVLVPSRTASGHRRYDEELLTRARLIRLCQHAGLTLAQIRELGVGDREARIELIVGMLDRIRADVSRLQRAERFLSHVVTCVHPMVSECPDCATFARAPDAGFVQHVAGRVASTGDLRPVRG